MADTAVTKRPALAAPLVQTMQSLMPHLPSLLPNDISTEQFRAALYLELAGRPALGECTPESVRNAVIKCATYGMLPGRDAHLLPFGSRRKGGQKEATYVANYFGLILALERSGKVRRAFAHAVHEGDQWEFDLFGDRPLHRPAVTLGKEAGRELFYYGAIMFKDGSCAFEVVTLEELDAVRRRSPAHEGGPWVSDRVMMCRKTALKRVAKYVHLTPESRAILAEDEVREREDMPTERQADNVHALFGPGVNPTAYVPPTPDAPPQHVAPANPLMARIEDELTRSGLSYEDREAWWEKMAATYADLEEPTVLAMLYERLLAEGPQDTRQETPGTPKAPSAPRSDEADTIDFFGSEGA
jgi:recombination protein RecT